MKSDSNSLSYWQLSESTRATLFGKGDWPLPGNHNSYREVPRLSWRCSESLILQDAICASQQERRVPSPKCLEARRTLGPWGVCWNLAMRPPLPCMWILGDSFPSTHRGVLNVMWGKEGSVAFRLGLPPEWLQEFRVPFRFLTPPRVSCRVTHICLCFWLCLFSVVWCWASFASSAE